MARLFQPFLKLPRSIDRIVGGSVNKNFGSVNLYFQDESRFGLKTHVGKCLTAMGKRPLAAYQHKFSSTYLWGSYSPIDGNSFVWEINGVSTQVFQAYPKAFSQTRPEEYKILVIDNAGFHSTSKLDIPNNIHLLRIPPYSPEPNPCEQIWQWIKQRFKNKVFQNMEELKIWLHQTVNEMDSTPIKSITQNHHYKNAFYDAINS